MCPNMMKNWDREAWQATVHGAAKSWTQLGNWATEQSTYMNLKNLSLINESNTYSNTSTPKHIIIEQLKDKVRNLQAIREVSCLC